MSEAIGEDITVSTEVTVPEPTPEAPTVEEGDTNVTIVEADDSSDVTVPAVIAHEGRLVAIEQNQAMILELLTNMSAAQVATAETAQVALEEATRPEPEPEPEPDRPPAKPHLLHRSWRELRQG